MKSKSDKYTLPLRLDPGYARRRGRFDAWPNSLAWRFVMALVMLTMALYTGRALYVLFLVFSPGMALTYWGMLAVIIWCLSLLAYYIWFGWRYWGSYPWDPHWTGYYLYPVTLKARLYYTYGRLVLVAAGLLIGFFNRSF